MSLFEDIQERVGEFSAYSNYFAMWCPYDDHKSMALFVYEDEDKPEDRRWFRCVSCGENGSHQKLWKKLTGQTVATIPGAAGANAGIHPGRTPDAAHCSG